MPCQPTGSDEPPGKFALLMAPSHGARRARWQVADADRWGGGGAARSSCPAAGVALVLAYLWQSGPHCPIRRLMSRTARLTRKTSETTIDLMLSLDGVGASEVDTGIGFLDHMLTAFARHGMLDLTVRAEGDLHIDDHHTTEDVGIVLGRAVSEALGDKRGIVRFGQAIIPMDEALIQAVIDISGRGFLAWKVQFEHSKVGTLDTELFEEFFRAFATNAGLTLHVTQKAGTNTHHIAEACFKAVARALRQATEGDPRAAGTVPSTKGAL